MGNTQSSVVSGHPEPVGPNTITHPPRPLLLLAAPSVDTQPWRIAGTLSSDEEERRVQSLAGSGKGNQGNCIVFYGLNATDPAPEAQVRKLREYGLEALCYRGGLFEWSLLREVFGQDAYGLDHVSGGGSEQCDPLNFLPLR